MPATHIKPYDQTLRIVNDLEQAGFVIRRKPAKRTPKQNPCGSFITGDEGNRILLALQDAGNSTK